MKYLFIGFLSISIFACSQERTNNTRGVNSENPNTSVATGSNQTAEPFALLELCTSEGCSDCPAAETILNEIALDAWADREYVYALSFHVDYWNKLGWKDEFSKSEFSDRQRAYRKAFENEVIYTPQMIVNGTDEFVGSDASKLKSAIKHALNQQPKTYFTITPNAEWTEITIDPVNTDQDMVEHAAEYELHTCIVERGLETRIIRGENEGRTLKHENIVRYIVTNDWSTQRSTQVLEYGADFNEKFSIISFVQHKSTRAIVGANIWNY
tara:strand:- start:1035 stop:1841 length:807 start_codon:yes stop_codon:yes gene_type:complete